MLSVPQALSIPLKILGSIHSQLCWVSCSRPSGPMLVSASLERIELWVIL